MRRWIAFVAVLYPRGWRDEFGEEFSALLDDVKPSWRVFRNVLGGAVRMQITEGTNWLRVAGCDGGCWRGCGWGIELYGGAALCVIGGDQRDSAGGSCAACVSGGASTTRRRARCGDGNHDTEPFEPSLTIINDPRLLLYTEEA